jgi:8-oxo-dGTP diphosphatase
MIIKVVAAVIVKENEILIARRKEGKHLEFKWEYPGGKVENNENEKESLKRELKEEFNISATIEDYITESFYEYDKAKINLKAYFVKNYTGTIKLIDHDKINWVKIDDLNNYEFAPADIPINNYLTKNGL